MRTRASASATVASGRSTIGSVVIRPPAVLSSYAISRRTSAASEGCISASSRSLSSSGSSPSRSAASSGSISSRTSAARSSLSLPRISIWSSSGSSSRTSARRSFVRADATSARRLGERWCRTLARSAGRSCSNVARRFSAPCPCSSSENPSTADQSTVSVSPLARRNAPPLLPLRTKTRSISQSLRAGSCWTETSRTVTSSPDSTSRTRRSSISPRTSRSVGRCSKRRTFSTPVVMTWPDSMPVTRVIGRKMRRRVESSTTSPSSRGGRRPTRSMATRSRTRPTMSPLGSKTAMPERCETKIRGAPAAMRRASFTSSCVLKVCFRLARPGPVRLCAASGRTGSVHRR